MKIYWSYRQIPEFAHLEPRARQRELRRLRSESLTAWQILWPLIVAGACAALGALVATALFEKQGFAFISTIVIGGGIGGFLATQITCHQYVGALRTRSHKRTAGLNA
jgi:uncharacterized oligopeptide transporter (OPT) family protein